MIIEPGDVVWMMMDNVPEEVEIIEIIETVDDVRYVVDLDDENIDMPCSCGFFGSKEELCLDVFGTFEASVNDNLFNDNVQLVKDLEVMSKRLDTIKNLVNAKL